MKSLKQIGGAAVAPTTLVDFEPGGVSDTARETALRGELGSLLGADAVLSDPDLIAPLLIARPPCSRRQFRIARGWMRTTRPGARIRAPTLV